ncbi:MAG TPA: sulfite exporter TauE/SafE family protein [bacterium]|nr:sulfite exporter TauE/SafE family protein [bacterium]
MVLVLQGLIAGIITGFLCGMFGMGGGSILIPVTVHVFGLPMKQAIGTSLVIIIFTSVSGLINYRRCNQVDTKLAFLILPFGIAGAQAGVFLTSRLPDSLVRYAFVFVTVSLGIKMFFQSENTVACELKGKKYNKAVAIIIGAIAGFVSGLCGVGGAVLIIPLFYLFLKIPMHACIGTALIVIFFNSLSGGIGYIIRGLVNFKIAILLAAGSMAAAPLGSGISIKTPKERLRKIFALILILSGLSILLR